MDNQRLQMGLTNEQYCYGKNCMTGLKSLPVTIPDPEGTWNGIIYHPNVISLYDNVTDLPPIDLSESSND